MTQSIAGWTAWTLLIAATTAAVGADTTLPRVFCLSPQALAQAKARAAAKDEALTPALEKRRKEAKSAMKAGPFSVVDNDLVPPSGDKHDYISFGPYWWPDPAKKDGLPYIRRDGEVYPGSQSGGSDSPALGKMTSAVYTLSLAYYLLGDEAYAKHATELLRAWFLDPATKMNPHLEYGQGIPGRVEGRATGIIDTVGLTHVVDAVGLLRGSRNWQDQDQAGMVAWFTAYLEWLRTSKHGREESAAKNNHGTWYDAQVAAFALFTGQDQVAREVIEVSQKKRITRHVEPDGRQPAELARTKPFGYSTFNLQALFTLATLGQTVNVDLWRYETEDGRSLRKALDFLADYADPEKAWPYRDLKFDRTLLIPLLQQGAAVYGTAYQQALARLPAKQVAESRGQLTYGR
ncbi:MAG: alginate lyase family protein [Candidatus Anammoximicrobium sp.]|nr:alginate lyase family protein [Candidatus Anammoximicrobium sp.]